jgi:hypothetical protein
LGFSKVEEYCHIGNITFLNHRYVYSDAAPAPRSYVDAFVLCDNLALDLI